MAVSLMHMMLWAQMISSRNHMVFTPLLASACVGTLECRSVALPLIDIQPQLKAPQVHMPVSCDHDITSMRQVRPIERRYTQAYALVSVQ